MALMLPLQVVDSFCRRCCSSNACTSNYDEKKLAELLVNKVKYYIHGSSFVFIRAK